MRPRILGHAEERLSCSQQLLLLTVCLRDWLHVAAFRVTWIQQPGWANAQFHGKPYAVIGCFLQACLQLTRLSLVRWRSTRSASSWRWACLVGNRPV